jgi:peptidoglycan/LPS O-acetylase OafA/YrhL
MTVIASMEHEVDQGPDGWTPLGHVGALDGLRAIAVMIVIAYHGGWFGVAGGFIGVDLFFLLSGFLITRLLLDEHHRSGTISMKNFYIRRALRLLPALFALVAGVWLAAALLPDSGLDDRLGNRTFWAVSYLANWNDVFTGTHFGPFSHLWSLSVEEQFYIVWPPVVLAVARRGGAPAVATVAALTAAVLSVTTALQFALGVSGFTLYFGTHSHGGILLLAGAWLGASPHVLERLPRDVALRLLVGGLAGLALMAMIPNRFSLLHPGLGYAPITAVSLALVVGAVCHPRLPVLHFGPLRRIGRASYGLYLWHIPMFAITSAVAPGVDRRVAIVAGTALATAGSHFLVERPALRLKSRWA